MSIAVGATWVDLTEALVRETSSDPVYITDVWYWGAMACKWPEGWAYDDDGVLVVHGKRVVLLEAVT